MPPRSPAATACRDRRPGRGGPEGVTGGGQAAAVEDDELLGNLTHGGPDACARLLPVAPAHAVQRGSVAAGVSADRADLVGRHIELVAAAVLDQQVVAFDTADGAGRHLLVAADPVLIVHDEIAGVERVIEVGAPARTARPPRHTGA